MTKSSPLESTITKKIMAFLKSQGCWAMKTHGGPRSGRVGIPDIIACVRPGGRLLAIEVKRWGNVPTLLQTREIEAIQASGGLAIVAHDVEDVREVVSELQSRNEDLEFCERIANKLGFGKRRFHNTIPIL